MDFDVRMAQPIDITGQTFGKLFVIRQVPRPVGANHSRLMWECLCSCGGTTVVTGKLLRRGETKSCGCLVSETTRKNRTKKPGHSGFIDLWHCYKHNSKQRSIKFLLSREEFRIITSKDCYYCGTRPSAVHCLKGLGMTPVGILNSIYVYSGVDRINSAGAYEWNNCVPCCKRCNYAKRDLSIEDFVAWARKLVEHQDQLCQG